MRGFTREHIRPDLKTLLLLLAAFNGFMGILVVKGSFSSPEIYVKDFAQEYLMAKAILSGVNPYLPVPELARIWLPESDYHTIKHPSLHPPIAGLLCLPLGLLSYRQASLIWLAFELICLTAAILLILRWLSQPMKPLFVVTALFLALGFTPVMYELKYGQLNACMLVLLIGSWLTLRSGKEWTGGTLLGAVIALKWIAWPIILFLMLRRRWKSVIAAGA